ncbi:DNA-binding response regulator [Hymenobacter sediminis]|uniref:response regulator n=1 Tax=Hymenobacter sediminis TaxID=2218621 RepID=UPI000DA673B4|nr:response regulator transcription factor [Hymenobacter sediminis]RPD44169.1 DNA-binding response regulator [Hymenobacter sediminis]
MIRLFLVDDHTMLRAGLRSLLALEPGLLVVGEAEHGQHLLDQLAETPADVVLLDLHMPGLDGLATTRRLRVEYPDVRVLILSMVDNELPIAQLLEAGATGYVLKNASKKELVVAIHTVAAGQPFLCSELGLLFLHKLVAREGVPAIAPGGELTPREREVLRLLGAGFTTGEIAEQLFTSPRTVEKHRQLILEKTGAKNTAALIRYAMTQGWLK